jgi:hypothetical protein
MYLKEYPFSVAYGGILTLETRPPGHPSGVVVYLRIVSSPEEASRPVNVSWCYNLLPLKNTV